MGQPWAPTVADVGALIPTRTRSDDPADDTMRLTFTDDTTPNTGQAQDAIDAAVYSIIGAAGEPPPDDGSVDESAIAMIWTNARNAVAWQAAADIELMFPQRVGDTTVWQQLTLRAVDALNDYKSALTQIGEGEVEAFPVGNFPQPGDLRASVLDRRPFLIEVP